MRGDDELRDRFRDLRRVDGTAAPEFPAVVDRSRVGRAKAPLHRSPVMWLAAAAAVVVALVATQRFRATSDGGRAIDHDLAVPDQQSCSRERASRALARPRFSRPFSMARHRQRFGAKEIDHAHDLHPDSRSYRGRGGAGAAAARPGIRPISGQLRWRSVRSSSSTASRSRHAEAIACPCRPPDPASRRRIGVVRPPTTRRRPSRPLSLSARVGHGTSRGDRPDRQAALGHSGRR